MGIYSNGIIYGIKIVIKKDGDSIIHFEKEEFNHAKSVAQKLFEEKTPFQIFIYSLYCTTYDKDDKPFMMWEKISYGDFLDLSSDLL